MISRAETANASFLAVHISYFEICVINSVVFNPSVSFIIFSLLFLFRGYDFLRLVFVLTFYLI
jgi:hypothetical protein